MSKRLLRSGLVVSAMTLISRLLGLVRDVVVANLMGAGAAADVFFFAQKIPNFLRRLFAEGAFSQAFVPVLTEYQAKGDVNETRLFIARSIGTLGAVITVVTLIGVIFSGAVTAVFGFGWFWDWLHNGPEAHKYVLASFLLKITFPYLWFITFVAISGSILNTLGKFAVSSFTPVFLNVSVIACALWLSPKLHTPEVGLAIGIFLGGLIQFLFQLPFLKRAGFLVKPQWGWNDPGVTRIRQLMLPAIFGVSVSQINLLFDTFIASFLMTGSISWLYYSDRLLEFPLGLFGIAIGTVILPALSRKHVDKSSTQFADTMDWGIRMIFLLGIPATIGLVVLAKPMLMVLFMRGEFNFVDVHQSAMSLWALSAGLLNFMLIKVLAPGYYARQDTKTPVRYGIIAMISNMVFNAMLAPFFGFVGLAMATSTSALLNAGLLYFGLHRDGVYRISRKTLGFVARLAAAGAAMIFALLEVMPNINVWLTWSTGHRGLWLAGLIVLGAVVYLIVALILGVRFHHLRTTDS